MKLRLTSAAIMVTILLACFPASAKRSTKGKRVADIPQSVVSSIAAGDLETAVIAMRDLPSQPKANYLIRECTRIVTNEMGQRPDRGESHNYYQNLAIAYHNLYLFLKARGLGNEEYFEKAIKFYKKARRAGTILHKAECDLLTAALYASSGEMEKAEKKASKIDEFMLRSDFESMEYLAAYYAATGDPQSASAALRHAFDLNPHRTRAWLEVSDDFHGIAKAECFKGTVAAIKKSKGNQQMKLTLPCDPAPKLDMTGGTPRFSSKVKRRLSRKKR